MNKTFVLLFSVIIIIFSSNISAQECAAPQADWVMCEDWETGVINRSVWNDGDIGNLNTITNSTVYAGNHALSMRHPSGSTGGWLNSIGNFSGYSGPLGNGHQKLFLRWYIRFSSSWDGAGAITKIAGFDIKPEGETNYWALNPNGNRGAGFRPDGEIILGGSRIVGGPGPIDFYTYHPYMTLDRWSSGDTLHCRYYGDHGPAHPDYVYDPSPLAITGHGLLVDNNYNLILDDSGNPIPDGRGADYYCDWDKGSDFANVKNNAPSPYIGDDSARAIGTDNWKCIEFELKANDPSTANGYQRLYLENELVGEWANITWTINDTVPKISNVQLTASSGSDHNTVYSYYDNIVVSTARIGCLGSDVPDTNPEPGGDDDTYKDPAYSTEDGGPGIMVNGCGMVSTAENSSLPVLFLLIVSLMLTKVVLRKP